MEGFLAPAYLETISAAPLGELRAKKAECEEVEVSLSYVRRMAEGRIDVLRAYLQRWSEPAGVVAGDGSSGNADREPGQERAGGELHTANLSGRNDGSWGGTGGETSELAELVTRLPSILAGGPPPPVGPGRMTRPFFPDTESQELTWELDRIFSAADLSRINEFDAGVLASRLDELVLFEYAVSGDRRSLHGVIGKLEDELVRRIKAGEASVESMIAEDQGS